MDNEGDKCKALGLDVRLRSHDSSGHPRAVNYTNVGVAQGIAYVDFGCIEPALIAAIANDATNAQAAPQAIEGQLVTRVAMGMDGLARLHRQVQEVLMRLRARAERNAGNTKS